MSESRLNARIVLALIGITAFALYVRLSGNDYRLPHAPEPDGVVLYAQVRAIERGDERAAEEDPIFGFYPLLVSRCVTWFTDPREPLSDGSLEDDLAQASDVHVRGRTVVAVLSTLSVPATFLLARTWLSAGWSLVAALFMATSILNIWFAAQFRPHAAASSFALLAVLASLELARRGRARDYVVCGVALGLAICTLQSGIALCVPFATAIVVRQVRSRDVSIAWTLAALAIVAAGAWLFYVWQVGVDGSDVHVSGHVVMLHLFNGGGFRKILDALVGYDPWLAGLACAGALLALHQFFTSMRRLDADLVVILAHAVPYLVVIGLYERTYQRFLLPLLPYLACLAAYTVLRASRLRPRIGAAIVAIFLVAPMLLSPLRLVRLRKEADTGARAAEWVRENVEADERVFVLPTLDLPLRRSPAALAALPEVGTRMSPWLDAQVNGELSPNPHQTFEIHTMPIPADDSRARILEEPEQYVGALGAQIAVVEVFDEAHRPVLAAIRRALAQSARLAVRIAPDDTSSMPLSYQDDELPERVPWAWRAMRARSYGPVIEVYDLR